MNWVLAYDVRSTDYLGTIALSAGVGAVMMVLGVLLSLGVFSESASPPNVSGADARVVGRVMFVFAALWTAWVCLGSIAHHRTLAAALNDGTASVVEGPIDHLRPIPRDGHGTEQIDVSGRHFEYADSIDTGAFNETGKLRAGETVRITYLNDEILRVELASPR